MQERTKGADVDDPLLDGDFERTSEMAVGDGERTHERGRKGTIEAGLAISI
jgi:hypothetical protein